jgi:hypothetical protein
MILQPRGELHYTDLLVHEFESEVLLIPTVVFTIRRKQDLEDKTRCVLADVHCIPKIKQDPLASDPDLKDQLAQLRYDPSNLNRTGIPKTHIPANVQSFIDDENRRERELHIISE